MDATEIKQQVSMARLYTELSGHECGQGKKLRCLLPGNHANGDANPSASIHSDHLTCHSQGCFKGDDIFSVIGKVENISDFNSQKARIKEMFSLNGNTHRKKIVTLYGYQDENGNLLYQTVRYAPKGFSQRRPNGNDRWIPNLKDTRLILFKLPEVMAAQNVLIVEGEKDVETAYTLGLPEGWVCTTSPMGAKKWKPQYSEVLKGKSVTIIPDSDVVGREHCEQIATSLAKVGVKVNTLTLPGNAHDLSDWVEADGTSEELCALLESAKVWEGTQGSEANEPEDRLLDESPGKTIARLAALSSLEYGQQRKPASEDLGVPLKFLDKAVTENQAANGMNKKPGQGSEITFDEIFPAEDPVDGVCLVEELTGIITRFMVLPGGAALTIALWILRTFAFDIFGISPRLAARSPVMQCGKSTLLELLSMLVPKPLMSSNCTPASLFRVIEKCQPTLLIDEMDSFQDAHEELRGILNSGHSRRSAWVMRTTGDDHEPRMFSTWCPMVLASIGKLSDTLEDRSLRIDLQRKKKMDVVESFPRQGVELVVLQTELDVIKSQCARWTQDNLQPIKNAEVTKLPELADRANDNWHSLLSVASAIGPDCLKKAKIAAVTISSTATEDTTSKVQLLIDIKELFEVGKVDRMASSAMCASLAALDERPWATWRKGLPISTNQLARLLRDFGVTSTTVRPRGDAPIKGYYKDHFQEAWGRYSVLGPEIGDLNRNNVTPRMDKGQTPDFQSVTEQPCNVSENSTLANTDAGCNVVTDENPKSQEPSTLSPQTKSCQGQEVIDLC